VWLFLRQILPVVFVVVGSEAGESLHGEEASLADAELRRRSKRPEFAGCGPRGDHHGAGIVIAPGGRRPLDAQSTLESAISLGAHRCSLRTGRFQHLFQLLGYYRQAVQFIKNSNPRVFWEAKISEFYNRKLAEYKSTQPPKLVWSLEDYIKSDARLLRPANSWRIMEVRPGSPYTQVYVRVDYNDRASAPGRTGLIPGYGLTGGKDGSIPVRAAWFTVLVDRIHGTVGADSSIGSSIMFMESVSEFWE
jgi:hypothetical protein